MAIENTVSIVFDLRSSIVDYVFDCHLPGVDIGRSTSEGRSVSSFPVLYKILF